MNDFGEEEKINIKNFDNFKVSENKLNVTVPSKSVITLEL